MKKLNFSAEFIRESAQLVVVQNYTVTDAAEAMNIWLSTMTRWAKYRNHPLLRRKKLRYTSRK